MSVYLSPQQLADRWSMDSRYIRESILPQLRGVIRIKRVYRIPMIAVTEFERLHTVTPRLQSVAGLNPDLIESNITK